MSSTDVIYAMPVGFLLDRIKYYEIRAHLNPMLA